MAAPVSFRGQSKKTEISECGRVVIAIVIVVTPVMITLVAVVVCIVVAIFAYPE